MFFCLGGGERAEIRQQYPDPDCACDEKGKMTQNSEIESVPKLFSSFWETVTALSCVIMLAAGQSANI